LTVSGRYEFFLRLPSEDEACWPRARNASVVVRGSGAYSHVTVDLDPNGDATTMDAIASSDRRLAGTVSEFPPGGSYISLGKYTLIRGADSLVTVDTTYAGDSCMAVDNVKMAFVEALSSGCTDPLAENYDAVVEVDDGSCLYRGGRGVNTKSWSAMSSQYKLDDWYPVEEYEVWATGQYCEVPDGFNHDNETAAGTTTAKCTSNAAPHLSAVWLLSIVGALQYTTLKIWILKAGNLFFGMTSTRQVTGTLACGEWPMNRKPRPSSACLTNSNHFAARAMVASSSRCVGLTPALSRASTGFSC